MDSGAFAAIDEPWVWSIDCFVSLSFSAAAIAVVLLDCVTSPSSPFEPTRIGALTLDGFFWIAVASATAF